MLRRRKVQPLVDEYISRRYEDTAVVIYEELRSGRGPRSLYPRWLEDHLEGFPAAQREKYSLLRERAGESDRTQLPAGKEEEGMVTAIAATDLSSKICIIL